jgi:aminopeptidase N
LILHNLRKFLLVLFCGAWAACLWAQTPVDQEDPPPADPRAFHQQELDRIRAGVPETPLPTPLATQDDFDVTYYFITLDVRNYSGHIFKGNVQINARSLTSGLSEMVLDLCSTFTVDSVVCNGRRTFTLSNNVLRITLDQAYNVGQAMTVRVYYTGVPCHLNSSVTFLNRNSTNRPTIFTLSEPNGAHDWWPCKDIVGDKADSMRMAIIVADTLTGTSNGALESVTTVAPSSKKFTWFESHPISTYLVCLNAANYANFRDWYIALNGDSVPIVHYPYPEMYGKAVYSWSGLPNMMHYLAQTFGEYPFKNEKYGHTMFNFGGGMEHTCNTGYGKSITDSSHFYDFIMVHELGHMWWGDDVTLATWPNVWLNEGFASYVEALWQEHLLGPSALQSYMTNTYYNGVSDPSGPVYNPPGDLFDGNTVYAKGAWILHIMRGVIRNDSLFFAAMRTYLAQHSYANATTAQFLSDMSNVVGYDLTPYMYAYLYRTNRPLFNVSFGSGMVDGALRSVVRISQTQTDPDTTFRTRLDVRLGAGTDSLRTRVENFQRDQRYFFNTTFTPLSLAVDPDKWVLRQITAVSLPLTIMNDSLPTATVGALYVDTLKAAGTGSSSATWSAPLGGLPPGLLLSENGLLFGIPTAAGNFQFKVQTTSTGSDTAWLTMNVKFPLVSPFPVTTRALQVTNQILLMWPHVPGADSYHVFRALHADSTSIDTMFTTTDTFFVDGLQQAFRDTVAFRFYYVKTVMNP